MNQTLPTPGTPASREAARARAAAAWSDLRDRLATVTPAALGRAVLAVTVIGAIVAAVAGTWPALLPFAAGGILAYAVLPVVDGLDRIMPRTLAAAISMLGVVALLVAVLVIIVPPLTTAIVSLAAQIPASEEIEAQLEDILAGLPAETRDIVGPVLLAVASIAEETLAGTSGNLRDLVGVGLQAALGVAGAVLGLIVLPTWLLTVTTANRRGRVALDRRLAGWLRTDFWAVVRMLDRAAGTYLRGFVVVAFVVGLLAWIGLQASPRVGGPTFEGPLALAVFAGAVQVIPELGPLLGFIPTLLLLAIDPERAVVYTAVYIGARILGATLIGGRLLEDRLGVHPAILIPGVVVLSQIGPLALLLSAPILAFGSDLVRYVHGRLSEPPRPAGLLPGEPVPATMSVGAPAPAPVPVAYRGRRTPAAPSPTAATTAAGTVTR